MPRYYSWDFWYSKAVDYANAHNGSIETIPRNYVTEDGYKLGEWIATQRKAYKNINIPKEQRTTGYRPLTDEQVEKLEKLGITWVAKKTWDEWYEIAASYAKNFENGLADITDEYVTANGENLGPWLANQKVAYKNRTIPKEKRKHYYIALTDEQVEKLEHLGMVWQKLKTWDEWYNIACAYAKEHNGTISSIKYRYVTKNGDNLGAWIGSQKVAYKNRDIPKEKRKNTCLPLTDEQVIKLEKIGIVWNTKITISWDKWYELVCDYAKNHDSSIATLDRSYVTEDGYKLGDWLQHQRQGYQNIGLAKEERKNTFAPLSEEKVKKLENVGMIWSNKDNRSKIFKMCKMYNIEIDKNTEILKTISASFLETKINYCLENSIPIIINGKLHEIFTMSSVNLYAKYGITLEELMSSYKLKLRKEN